MIRIRLGKNALRSAVAGVIAATMLAGCGGTGGRVSSANNGTVRAESSGAIERGVRRAEAAVVKSPRDGALRATLYTPAVDSRAQPSSRVSQSNQR